MSDDSMKFALLVGDGMADYALDEIGGQTPLEAADTPHMDRLALKGAMGLVRTIPEGMPPGSDIANLSLLGYDVTRYYTGRAPLEAASQEIELSDEEVAFRCNLVTVTDETMVDYSAGHITSGEAAELIAAVDRELGRPELKFYPGVSYRHLMVARLDGDDNWDKGLVCTPPHDIISQPIADYLPAGTEEDLFRKLMIDSVEILAEHPVNKSRVESGKRPANMIWLWGQGKRPSMPTFRELYGMNGAVISAVDLIRGIGKNAGLSVIEVPGATGYYDTNYAGKASYGIEALERFDFLFLHVEAPDEAGHASDLQEKIRAIENFDKLVVGPVLEGMSRREKFRIMVMPDHPTPIPVGTHVGDPVPYVVCGTGIEADRTSAFSEAEAKTTGIMIENGFELLPPYLKM